MKTVTINDIKTVAIIVVCLLLAAWLMFAVRVSPNAASGWWSWFAELGKGSVAVLFVAIAAYALKRRWRLAYGVCELLVFLPAAMSFLFGLIQKASPDDVSKDWANWSGSTIIILGLVTVGLAGIRAVEDIGEGLSGKSKKYWDWLFEKPQPTAA
jgi:hypothetical protein